MRGRTHDCRRLEHDGGTQQAGRAHQACAEARNDSVDRPKVRRSRPRPIKNQQLMFEQKRLGDNGTSAARSEDFDDRGDEMDEKDGQVAHLAIVATSTNVTRLGYPQDLCDKSEIRHTQAQQRVVEVRGVQGGLVRSWGDKLLDALAGLIEFAVVTPRQVRAGTVLTREHGRH